LPELLRNIYAERFHNAEGHYFRRHSIDDTRYLARHDGRSATPEQ
jgi:hypothetical protein